MQRVVARARRVAPRRIPVLIEGESGTGKELFARAIHQAGPHSERPMITVNCGAIAPELIESELFGFEKGAFTGAVGPRQGVFEAADTGTLFLDEIGELPKAAQIRFLRALQEGEITRVGATTPKRIDVRIIAATNRSLTREVAAGRFREDLFYRLAVAVITLPPLRERDGDARLLLDRLLDQVNRESATEPGPFLKEVAQAALHRGQTPAARPPLARQCPRVAQHPASRRRLDPRRHHRHRRRPRRPAAGPGWPAGPRPDPGPRHPPRH
jgi:transcriptional regulator with PAS, ATPase and Fis domain